MSDTPTPGWHLKKEIQLGHLITTLTVAVSVVVYITKVEQRVALLEANMVQQHDRDERQDKASADSIALLRAQLDKIDSKLDRLLEGRR